MTAFPFVESNDTVERPGRDLSRMAPARPFFLALAAFVTFAGCATPDADRGATSVTPTSPTAPAASEQDACLDFDVTATPRVGPAVVPRVLEAELRNCGNETLELAHACTRGLDIRLHVLYNSTDPENATPPGLAPKATYLVDNPVANRPLACATAPPHVREVPAGYTLSYVVNWSGLVDDPSCGLAPCPRPLAAGHYLVSARAEDAKTGDERLATVWIELT